MPFGVGGLGRLFGFAFCFGLYVLAVYVPFVRGRFVFRFGGRLLLCYSVIRLYEGFNRFFPYVGGYTIEGYARGFRNLI